MPGRDEALLVRDSGLVTEGSWTKCSSSATACCSPRRWRWACCPACCARSLIEAGRAREAELTLDDLAEGFLLGNALRGLMPAVLA